MKLLIGVITVALIMGGGGCDGNHGNDYGNSTGLAKFGHNNTKAVCETNIVECGTVSPSCQSGCKAVAKGYCVSFDLSSISIVELIQNPFCPVTGINTVDYCTSTEEDCHKLCKATMDKQCPLFKSATCCKVV